MSLPSGLDQLWQALAPFTDALDKAITLVFLRQLLDPEMPALAGYDPRTRVAPKPPWALIVADGNRACWLEAPVDRPNALMGEALLTGGWESAPASTVAQMVMAISKWKPAPYTGGGDVLGELLERVRPEKTARGAFYTPYNVTFAMAKILEPQPGESVCDPACGSGRVLLAALQACREDHNDGEPILYGMDIDVDAVRVCKLNMWLAGYGTAAIAHPDSVLGKRIRETLARDADTSAAEQTLTSAQRRVLAEVRADGERTYNGRARKPIKALERTGLVDAERGHDTGEGGERITVRPRPAA
jgi:hypothetical protein